MIFSVLLILLLFLLQPIAGIKEGDYCDPEKNKDWIASPFAHLFLYCHNGTKEYAIAQCSIESGQQKIFNAQRQQCMPPEPPMKDNPLHNSLYIFNKSRDNEQQQSTYPRHVVGERKAIAAGPHAVNMPFDFGTPNLFVTPPFISLKQALRKNTTNLQRIPPFKSNQLRNLRPISPANIRDKTFEKKSRSIGSATAIGNFFGQTNKGFNFGQRRIQYNPCPGNRRPMLRPLNRNVVKCSLSSMKRSQDGQMDDDCQHRDFRCTFSSIEENFGICCQRLDYHFVTCPPNTRPMTMDSHGTHRLKECSPTIYGDCHSKNAICIFKMGDYHCCQDTYTNSKDNIDNSQGYVETSVVIYMKNASNKSSATLKNKPHKPQFVKSRPSKVEKHEEEEENNKCPVGQQPFKDPLNEAPTFECNVTKGDSCPPGFHCHESNTTGLCCGITSVCGANSGALINPLTNHKISCNAEEGCPEPFYCNTLTGTCCSMDPVAGLCNHGISLLDANAKAVNCTEKDICPYGFSCLRRFNFSLCCPTKQNICSQPINTGLQCLASPPQTAYYFNKNLGKCENFTYTGCSGNQRSDNRFDDEQQCMEICQPTCPIGSPLVLPNRKTMKCILESDGTRKRQICPSGYLCLESSQGYSQSGVCCPKPEKDVCEFMHAEPYVISAEQYPMTCSINTKNERSSQKPKSATCPPNFDCFQSKSSGVGFCCRIGHQYHPTSTTPPPLALNQKERCENGDQPYRNSGQVRLCSIHVEVEYEDDDETLEFEAPPYCPKQYRCEFSAALRHFQCCPDVTSLSLKEKNYTINETEKGQLKLEELCPPGYVPALHPNTNQPTFCHGFSFVNCPPDSTCVHSPTYSTFVCCA